MQKNGIFYWHANKNKLLDKSKRFPVRFSLSHSISFSLSWNLDLIYLPGQMGYYRKNSLTKIQNFAMNQRILKNIPEGLKEEENSYVLGKCKLNIERISFMIFERIKLKP